MRRGWQRFVPDRAWSVDVHAVLQPALSSYAVEVKAVVRFGAGGAGAGMSKDGLGDSGGDVVRAARLDEPLAAYD